MLAVSDKNFLVFGLGISGQAAAEFLIHSGARVTGVDHQWKRIKDQPEIVALVNRGMQIIPETDLEIDDFDGMIVSPGISPNESLYQKAIRGQIPIMGEAELALRYITTPCLGVTGTNGKTTVTLLIEHVLRCCGIPSKAVGNVGMPLSSLLASKNQVVEGTVLVVELSSYQLETMTCKALDAAVILNVTPDHFDRHHDLEGCARAKARIFECMKPNSECYISQKCIEDWPWMMNNHKLNCYEEAELELPASYVGHDKSNILAAYCLCKRFGIEKKQFLSALDTFQKPPHRVQRVTSIAGINFIDDSKATNIDAVIKAVESLHGNIILIAGGVDKGSSYLPWLETFRGKVREIFTIGKAAPKIVSELSAHIPSKICDSLESAVALAFKSAANGDTVLLSPGCSSYDMFTDYAHRGREFQRIVRELIK